MSDSTFQTTLNTPYCSDLPYPAANKVQRQNTYYASLLAEDYAGAGSEMTATTGYLYYSFITESCNEELSCILKRIALAEQTHINMLGKLICALGSTPKFQTVVNNKCVSWTASHLTYSCNISDILTNSIKGEQGAIKQYTEHANQICDPYVQAVIERIILDERLHESTLLYYLCKYGN